MQDRREFPLSAQDASNALAILDRAPIKADEAQTVAVLRYRLARIAGDDERAEAIYQEIAEGFGLGESVGTGFVPLGKV